MRAERVYPAAAQTLVVLVKEHIFKNPDALRISMTVFLAPVIMAAYVLCLGSRQVYEGRRRNSPPEAECL